MKKVRWSVIGAGGIARRRTIPEGILPARNAELVSVYAPNSGADVAKQFGVASADSEQSIFDSDCDAIYVASPVNFHVNQVVQAARAGKHVLCEKPLGLNVDEAEQMLAACELAGVKFGVAFMMRGHPLHRKAQELVKSDAIGRPTYARAQLSCWYPPIKNAWRLDPLQGGGGALPDLASHCLDLLEIVLGQKIASVTAVVKTLVHDYPVDDTVVLTLEFDGDTVATIDCLFNLPDEAAPNRLEIYGSAGSILTEGTLGQATDGTMKWFEQNRAAGYGSDQSRGTQAGWRCADYEPTNMYQIQIEEFSGAILRDSAPSVPGTQGLWIQRVLGACQESAAIGRRVQLSRH
jgi:predicted dehydrogenase